MSERGQDNAQKRMWGLSCTREHMSYLKEQQLLSVHQSLSCQNVYPVWPKLPVFQEKSGIQILCEMSPFQNNDSIFLKMFHGASQTCPWAKFSQWANNIEPLKERYRAQFSFPPVLFHCHNMLWLCIPAKYSYGGRRDRMNGFQRDESNRGHFRV